MSKVNGYIMYEGPSEIDGKPIVVIATGFAKGSSNTKTGGGLIQTWILRADVDPVSATHSGADESICGDCPHRGRVERRKDGLLRNVARSCYVTVFQAPLVVWKAWKRGIYPKAVGREATALAAGRMIRVGSYGDPAAVPAYVWEDFLAEAAGWTGYTHQWHKRPDLAAFCMASADSIEDRTAANAAGFRTFRVTTADVKADKANGEIICPASKEAGFKTTCDACKACGGNGAKAKADVVIQIHGAAAKVNAAVTRKAVRPTPRPTEKLYAVETSIEAYTS
jgi:hypothetical protein